MQYYDFGQPAFKFQPPSPVRQPGGPDAAPGQRNALAPSARPSATAQPSAPPPAPGPTSVDYTSDPILARVKALGAQREAEAAAFGRQQQISVALGYGDPNLARQLGLGDTYAQAAEANPFSTTKELARGYQRRDVFDINRPLSDYKNLFYSSERARQLGLSSEQYMRDQANAQAQVQQQLAQIAQQVAQAKLQAQADQIQAEQDAYQRALQAALG